MCSVCSRTTACGVADAVLQLGAVCEVLLLCVHRVVPACAGECGRNTNITAAFLATRGDLVLVGDLLMSMSLLQYHAIDSKLEELGGGSIACLFTCCVRIPRDTASRSYSPPSARSPPHTHPHEPHTLYQSPPPFALRLAHVHPCSSCSCELCVCVCVLSVACDVFLRSAVEQNTVHMTAVAFVDDSTYMGADDNFNVFIAERRADAPTEEVCWVARVITVLGGALAAPRSEASCALGSVLGCGSQQRQSHPPPPPVALCALCV